MKKIIIAILVCVFLLCGCSQNENIAEKKNNTHIEIWTDKETGVQYIIYKELMCNCGMGGITPRLNADGSLYVEFEEGNNANNE